MTALDIAIAQTIQDREVLIGQIAAFSSTHRCGSIGEDTTETYLSQCRDRLREAEQHLRAAGVSLA